MSNNVQVALLCMADPRHHLRFGSCCRKFYGRDFDDVQAFQLPRLLDGESSCLAKEQLRPYRISCRILLQKVVSLPLSNPYEVIQPESRRRQLSSPLQTVRYSSSDSITRCCTTPSSECLKPALMAPIRPV
jgi:hypothetical protein